MLDLVCAEKNLPYTATYIEEGETKPDWYVVMYSASFHVIVLYTI